MSQESNKHQQQRRMTLAEFDCRLLHRPALVLQVQATNHSCSKIQCRANKKSTPVNKLGIESKMSELLSLTLQVQPH